MYDGLANGHSFRTLIVVDEFTRECLALEVGGSFKAPRIINVLADLFQIHGPPGFIRSDNGPEFIANAIRKWLNSQSVGPFHIDPGSPWQNPFAESFIGKFRDECLNAEYFYNIADARMIITRWKNDYNACRPHSSLDYQTPLEFKKHWIESNMGALPPCPRDLSLCGLPDGLCSQ